MAVKTLVSALALAAGITSVAATTCDYLPQTTAGFKLHFPNSKFPTKNVSLRPSKTGNFNYLAIDSSSPELVANYENGVIFRVDNHLAPLDETVFLINYQVDASVNPPTTTGIIASASSGAFANATDVNWLLHASGVNDYNLWHQEPVNTITGVQLVQADFDLNKDGSPWYYLRYVDWVSKLPTDGTFSACIATVATSDSNSC